MSDHIPCLVPGCRRTARRLASDDSDTEIICGKHWRLADKRARLLLGKIVRKGRRLDWPGQLINAYWRVWARIRRQVIERAVGI